MDRRKSIAQLPENSDGKVVLTWVEAAGGMDGETTNKIILPHK
jgi:hypothetical protein